MQGLVNELTALGTCVAAWQPRLLMAGPSDSAIGPSPPLLVSVPPPTRPALLYLSLHNCCHPVVKQRARLFALHVHLHTLPLKAGAVECLNAHGPLERTCFGRQHAARCSGVVSTGPGGGGGRVRCPRARTTAVTECWHPVRSSRSWQYTNMSAQTSCWSALLDR